MNEHRYVHSLLLDVDVPFQFSNVKLLNCNREGTSVLIAPKHTQPSLRQQSSNPTRLIRIGMRWEGKRRKREGKGKENWDSHPYSRLTPVGLIQMDGKTNPIQFKVVSDNVGHEACEALFLVVIQVTPPLQTVQTPSLSSFLPMRIHPKSQNEWSGRT